MRCRDRLLVIALALLAPAAAYAQSMGLGAGVPDVAMVYPRGGATSPGLDYIFSAGSYYQNGTPACVSAATCLTVTRASVGTAVDASGNWSSFANNIARITNVGLTVEEARTNSTRNNTMVGAVAGTPGTLPTNWTIAVADSLTTNVIGTGTESGINYIDLQVVGTPDASGSWVLSFDAAASPASQNQVWTGSVFIKLVGGNLTNISSTVAVIQSLTAGLGFLSQGAGTCSVPTVASLTSQRCFEAYTLPDATAGAVNFLLAFVTTTGQPVNVTLRIGWPQLELGAFATTPIKTTNATVTRAADVVAVTTVPSIGSAYTDFASGTPAAPATFASNQALYWVSDGTNTNTSGLYRIASTGNAGNTPAGTGGTVGNFAFNGTLNVAPVLAQSTIVKGAVALTGASGMTAVNIGSRGDGTLQWNGTIQRVSLWPTVALTSGQVTNLTK
jgi:hypothetical protein